MTDDQFQSILAGLGWEITQTGGGDMALALALDDGSHCLLTDDSGTEIPQWGETLVFWRHPDAFDAGSDPAEELPFSLDCDGLGTPGYSVTRDGLAIVDPTQGSGSSWGYPMDPAVYHVHPALAAVMAATYRQKGA
jgi:hypothetical protein